MEIIDYLELKRLFETSLLQKLITQSHGHYHVYVKELQGIQIIR